MNQFFFFHFEPCERKYHRSPPEQDADQVDIVRLMQVFWVETDELFFSHRVCRATWGKNFCQGQLLHTRLRYWEQWLPSYITFPIRVTSTLLIETLLQSAAHLTTLQHLTVKLVNAVCLYFGLQVLRNVGSVPKCPIKIIWFFLVQIYHVGSADIQQESAALCSGVVDTSLHATS